MNRKINKWTILSLCLSGLIILPFVSLFKGFREINLSFFSAFISDYALNTYLLGAITVLVGVFFGFFSAYAVVNYKFKGRKFFSAFLVLPLAIPSYIAAYTYHGIFSPFGTTHQLFNFYYDIKSIFFLSIIMASVLFPYVFLATKAALLLRSIKLQEIAKTLGLSNKQVFFRVTLPTIFPALIGGMMLILMEVLNNYGAVHYFGLKTFSTEIIRLWNPINITPVLLISIRLILIVCVLLIIEKSFRRRKKYYGNYSGMQLPKSVSNKEKVWVYIACVVPLILGFLLPISQLIYWAVKNLSKVIDDYFLQLISNTFFLAIVSTFICIIISLIIRYSLALSYNKLNRLSARMSTIGYSLPGAVVAICVLVPIALINQYFSILLTASYSLLIFSYVIRFNAVSYSTIDGGFKKLSPNLIEASRNLGLNRFKTLLKIILPSLKPSIVAALILVFVDIIKELPLTMLFSTFNFETLAVKAFMMMQTDGAVYQASVPSLMVVLVGLFPVLLLNKIMHQK